MWLTSNGEQKGAYSLIPFNRLSGNFVNRMGTHATVYESEGPPYDCDY